MRTCVNFDMTAPWTKTELEQESHRRQKDQANNWWHKGHNSAVESSTTREMSIPSNMGASFVLRHMTVSSNDQNAKSDDEHRSCWSMVFDCLHVHVTLCRRPQNTFSSTVQPVVLHSAKPGQRVSSNWCSSGDAPTTWRRLWAHRGHWPARLMLNYNVDRRRRMSNVSIQSKTQEHQRKQTNKKASKHTKTNNTT